MYSDTDKLWCPPLMRWKRVPFGIKTSLNDTRHSWWLRKVSHTISQATRT